MIIATGTSITHLGAMANYVIEALVAQQIPVMEVEGKGDSDWVLIDTPYTVIHLFLPEARKHYNLERMWQPNFSGSSTNVEHVSF